MLLVATGGGSRGICRSVAILAVLTHEMHIVAASADWADGWAEMVE